MTDPNVITLLTRIAIASEAMLTELQKLSLPAQSPTASQPTHGVTPTNGNGSYGYRDFACTTIILSYDDKGEATYKAQGVPYSKFGVRIWPEVLPTLGIDPAALQPGPNPFVANLRAEMGDKGPRKVIGLATPQPAPAPDTHLASAHDERSDLPF